MNRDRCGACASTILRPFLDLGTSPLADAFPRGADEPEKRYPLRLVVCESCWLVQLEHVVPDDELYNPDYGFYTGASPSSIDYFRRYADWLRGYFPGEHRQIVEIASNDGTFLRNFPDRAVLGVEPSANVAAVAQAAGIPTVVRPFGRDTADMIRSEHGPAGIIVASNVMAHVSDLDDFVGGITTLLAHDGAAVIEVQYLPDLLVGNQFDHVYHEHRSFFSFTTLDSVLARHGLHIADFTFTEAQGGSLRAVVRRGEPLGHADIREAEHWLASPSAYAGVQGRAERIRERVLALIDAERAVGRRVAGYAASAKSTTLLNFCGIGRDRLDYVLDVTPAKIGRVTPGTHIPIRAEGDADTYLLMAWNYLPGVLRRERKFMADGGRFIVPVPAPVLL